MNFDVFDPTSSREAKKSSRIFTGALFILLGTIFFLAQADISIFGYSPWIFMALLPVFWGLATTYRFIQKDGRISARVLIQLFFSFVPIAFVAAAMAGLNMAALIPVGFVALGIIFLFSNR